MDIERREFIKARLSQAVREFFHDYGVDCVAVEGASRKTTPSEGEVGAIIGFGGNHVRGGLAFVAPQELVAHMLPVPQVEARAELQLRAWSAEMTNQLIGRFKNKLSARALDFDVGTAVCFRARSIRLSLLPDADSVALSFTAALAGVHVYLDCSFTSDFVGVEEVDMGVVSEGDVVLF